MPHIFRAAMSLAAVLSASVVALPAAADVIGFTVAVNGAQQVPPNTAPGAGALAATYDTVTHVLNWSLLYSGLTGPATAGHFHGPAEIGENAGVAIAFEGALTSPVLGTATLTPEQERELLDGLWYVNIHTAAFPGGEIRGQLVPNPPGN